MTDDQLYNHSLRNSLDLNAHIHHNDKENNKQSVMLFFLCYNAE